MVGCTQWNTTRHCIRPTTVSDKMIYQMRMIIILRCFYSLMMLKFTLTLIMLTTVYSALSLQRGSVDPKFHVEGVAPTNYSSCQKTRINCLSYDIKILPKFQSPEYIGCTNHGSYGQGKSGNFE